MALAPRSMKIYVTAPAAALAGAEMPLRFTLRDTGGAETAVYDSHFARP